MQQLPTAEPTGIVSPTQRVGKSAKSKSRNVSLHGGYLLRCSLEGLSSCTSELSGKDLT